MNDTQYAAAVAAASTVAAAYATARPAVTSDEHITAIVRVFEKIYESAAAKSAAA